MSERKVNKRFEARFRGAGAGAETAAARETREIPRPVGTESNFRVQEVSRTEAVQERGGTGNNVGSAPAHVLKPVGSTGQSIAPVSGKPINLGKPVSAEEPVLPGMVSEAERQDGWGSAREAELQDELSALRKEYGEALGELASLRPLESKVKGLEAEIARLNKLETETEALRAAKESAEKRAEAEKNAAEKARRAQRELEARLKKASDTAREAQEALKASQASAQQLERDLTQADNLIVVLGAENERLRKECNNKRTGTPVSEWIEALEEKLQRLDNLDARLQRIEAIAYEDPDGSYDGDNGPEGPIVA